MIYPKNLENGYKIGVTATSEGFVKETDVRRLERGIRHFSEMGYPVIETTNVRKGFKGRSSDGLTRAKEFMELFDETELRVIFAASGGDYLVEMLPYIDYDLLRQMDPKWVQGYSDTTGLTFTLTTNLDIATIYASNFSSFGMDDWHSSLKDNIKILEGRDFIQESFEHFQDGFKEKITGLEGYVLDKDVEWKNLYPTGSTSDEITIKGRALGGCLDVLLSLIGTRFDKTVEFIEKYKQDGILWFLESYDLNSEALTKGLWQLKEAGWFAHASGFIFGRPAMFDTDTDTTYEEAVVSVLGELNLPIILDADIGHKPPQLTMMNGAITTIRSKGGKGNITFERR